MSITSGFFNSFDHDRRYNALQLSSMFDGIIRDGVFSTIGSSLMVTAGTGLTVNVGIGKAWFNHTWINNDSIYPISLNAAHSTFSRIDTVILDMNATTSVRENSIIIIDGTASSSPSPAELINEEDHHQYPLAYVTVPARATSIVAENIQNTIGTDACPFVTGLLQQMSIEELGVQWWAEFESVLDRLQEELRNVEDDVAFDFKPIRIEDATIPSSSFQEYVPSGEEETGLKEELGFEYRAAYPVDTLTSDMIPYVTLSLTSLSLSRATIANVFRTYNGGFYIYSDSIPDADTPVKILTAEFRRGVVNV